MQKDEKKIKMYIFRTRGAICENFVRDHFLKASFHHHYRVDFKFSDTLNVNLWLIGSY